MQGCNLRQDLSNGMWHATFMQVNQGNFLTFSGRESNWQFDSWPFFGHNLCFKYANES
jgi:hypothetical protein